MLIRGRTGGSSLGDGGSGIAHPGFPCTYFGWEFLSRMVWFPQAAGRPLSASMPNRAKPDILVRFPLCFRILLRNSRRKRSTENRDRQSRCRRPAKKSLPCWVKYKECYDARLYFLIPSRQMYVTICGRFAPNEGRIAGYMDASKRTVSCFFEISPSR